MIGPERLSCGDAWFWRQIQPLLDAAEAQWRAAMWAAFNPPGIERLREAMARLPPSRPPWGGFREPVYPDHLSESVRITSVTAHYGDPRTRS